MSRRQREKRRKKAKPKRSKEEWDDSTDEDIDYDKNDYNENKRERQKESKKAKRSELRENIQKNKEKNKNEIEKIRKEIQKLMKNPKITSKTAFRRELRNMGFQRRLVNQQVENIEAFRIHRQENKRLRKRHEQRTIASKVGMVVVDIADYPHNHPKYPNYIFVCVDIFSRYMFALPMKEKSSRCYVSRMKRIMRQLKNFPSETTYRKNKNDNNEEDDEKEADPSNIQPNPKINMKITHIVSDNAFNSKDWNDMLVEYGITPIYSMPNEPHHTKTAIVESGIKTLRQKCAIFLRNNPRSRINEQNLRTIVDGYNEERHSAIGVSPKFVLHHHFVFPPKRFGNIQRQYIPVLDENGNQVYDEYGNNKREWYDKRDVENISDRELTDVLEVGDNVRLLVQQNAFGNKGYLPKYSKDIYEVIEVKGQRYIIQNTKTKETLKHPQPRHRLLKENMDTLIRPENINEDNNNENINDDNSNNNNFPNIDTTPQLLPSDYTNAFGQTANEYANEKNITKEQLIQNKRYVANRVNKNYTNNMNVDDKGEAMNIEIQWYRQREWRYYGIYIPSPNNINNDMMSDNETSSAQNESPQQNIQNDNLENEIQNINENIQDINENIQNINDNFSAHNEPPQQNIQNDLGEPRMLPKNETDYLGWTATDFYYMFSSKLEISDATDRSNQYTYKDRNRLMKIVPVEKDENDNSAIREDDDDDDYRYEGYYPVSVLNERGNDRARHYDVRGENAETTPPPQDIENQRYLGRLPPTMLNTFVSMPPIPSREQLIERVPHLNSEITLPNINETFETPPSTPDPPIFEPLQLQPESQPLPTPDPILNIPDLNTTFPTPSPTPPPALPTPPPPKNTHQRKHIKKRKKVLRLRRRRKQLEKEIQKLYVEELDLINEIKNMS